MEYESGKASSDVLKPRYIYKIFVYYNGCLHPSYKYANLLRERKLPQAILVTTKQTGNYVKRNNYKFLLFLKYQHDVQQAHPASYSMDSRYFPSTWFGRGVKLTNHIHLVPRLRTSGAILLPPYMYLCPGKGQLYHNLQRK